MQRPYSQLLGKIGFACIALDSNGEKVESQRYRTATVAYVEKLKSGERYTYLAEIARHNLTALESVVRTLRTKPITQRMYRITSDLFPLYTHEIGKAIYAELDLKAEMRERLAEIGRIARHGSIEGATRLSFHPGQFCVLNSAKEAVRRSAIEEFEYHTQVAQWMGYSGGNRAGGWPMGSYSIDGFCINVHGGAWHEASKGNISREDWKTNLASWDWSWQRLSEGARRLLTLENDEMAWTAQAILELCQRLEVRMVPDVHHHWVESGQWLDPASTFGRDIRRTWMYGGGPKMHVSMPQAEILYPDGSTTDKPVWSGERWDRALPVFPAGVSKSKLRAHSNYIYHQGMVKYLHEWSDAGWDIMVECKHKNLASDALHAAMLAYGNSRRRDRLDHFNGYLLGLNSYRPGKH